MVTSECSAFVKLFAKSKDEEMKQSGLGVHTVLQTLLNDKNKVFCQLGRSYSKVRDWGQDTRVIVGVMGSPITQLIQTYNSKFRGIQKKMAPCKIRLHLERQQSTVRCCWIPKWCTGYTGTMSSTNHSELVFAQGINADLLCEPLCSKYGEWEKKTILKWCLLSCYLKLLGNILYTLHAREDYRQLSQCKMRNSLFFPTIKIPRI